MTFELKINKSQTLISLLPLPEENMSFEEDYSTEKDKKFIRDAIMEEYRAANLYERMANMTKSESVKKVLLHIAREEKVHIGELSFLLEQIDEEFSTSLLEGRMEAVEELSLSPEGVA